MSKIIKQMVISDIESRVGDTRDMLVIDSSRIDAITSNRFRLALQDRGIVALTVKNSLARKALGNLGVSSLDPVLEGPSTLVWGDEDIVALSKEIAKWAKEIGELEIKGGTADGKTLDSDAVEKLSKSPGRLELLSIIAGQILSPGASLAAALNGPGGKLAGQLTTMSKEESGGDD